MKKSFFVILMTMVFIECDALWLAYVSILEKEGFVMKYLRATYKLATRNYKVNSLQVSLFLVIAIPRSHVFAHTFSFEINIK